MGRHQKVNLSDDGIDRRKTGYYSTPDFVVEYIVRRCLDIKPSSMSALDPCVGKGEFTQHLKKAGLSTKGVDVLNMEPIGVDEFIQADFIQLALGQKSFGSSHPSELSPDIFVANPPYNCHETEYIRANKSALADAYGKHAVLNMYALFLAAMIRVARPGSVIGAITLDSFLTARGYEPLRKQIFSECTIHELRLCPTDLFRSQGADVRTCIIILEKGVSDDVAAKVSSRPPDTFSFRRALQNAPALTVNRDLLFLSGNDDRFEIQVDVPDEVLSLFDERRLGQVAPCVTGISTGKDKEYISHSRSDKFSFPFYKNPGSKRFYAPPGGYLTSDFLEISERVPNFMVRNKNLLFKGGISCSSMGVQFGAALLPENSTFGVNANIIVSGEAQWEMLAYLNSSLANFMVRSVLIRSNMITAGYVSRIPYPQLSKKSLNYMSAIAREAYSQRCSPKQSKKFVTEIDEVLNSEIGLTPETVAKIDKFCSDIVRLT
ncbi:N-6 DNA methylase [Ponticaulis profundi]|uniref:site-specific DNA-methyltransferase (adenine-specific) n=1 Tax=Ponticaulis profundi TaxID=2665222 RepID=A0ABW1S6A1_9PROT